MNKSETILSVIAHWVFVLIIYIYFTTQMTEKYKPAMCYCGTRRLYGQITKYISLNCCNLAFSLSLSLFISLLNQKLILKLESDLKMYSYDCGIRWLYGQRGSTSHSTATIWPFHFHFPFFLISLSLF